MQNAFNNHQKSILQLVKQEVLPGYKVTKDNLTYLDCYFCFVPDLQSCLM